MNTTKLEQKDSRKDSPKNKIYKKNTIISYYGRIQ